MTLLMVYPFVLDGLRIFISGIIFEATRRASSASLGAFRRGILKPFDGAIHPLTSVAAFSLTIRISEADESYSWVHRWLSDEVMSTGSSDKTTPLWLSFLEVIQPTGRCPPRDVTVQTTIPKSNFWMHMEMEERAKEKMDILLGKVRMRLTPSIG